MGHTQSNGKFFHKTSVKEQFASLQTLWDEKDFACLLNRLKEVTLNFSLAKDKFGAVLLLPVTYKDVMAQWFEDFSRDRASQAVDGLEFISASIMISSKVTLFRKLCLLFDLFDLDKTKRIRKDEFTILLKAVTTGLHRMTNGLPPPSTVLELGTVSTELFASRSDQALSQQNLLSWMTEEILSLRYLSVLSNLGVAIFAWGSNDRFQLGLNFEPTMQELPAPLLPLEGIRVASIASQESHTLFLTEEGRLWSCGYGFCGILGHGDTTDCWQPRPLESLTHVRLVDVAVGVRHSVAVSEKGQVFSWGSADLGQLGHGDIEDTETHEVAFNPKTGDTFSYVKKPTVIMSLFGKKIFAKRAACCNFSTAIITSQGQLYTWGNNTDGQCGQGQRCPHHKPLHVEPHMSRTGMQVLMDPKLVEGIPRLKAISCGGYHALAIDEGDHLFSWGLGVWGRLGHQDQRSMYEPKLVEVLKYQICQSVAAGGSHSVCLTRLCRLTLVGTSREMHTDPFSLLALPLGRMDQNAASRCMVTPPNSTLSFFGFACAQLLEVGSPFHYGPGVPIIDFEQYPVELIQDSIILINRGLWPGEWLKISTSDLDFHIQMSKSGRQIPVRTGISGPLMFAQEGKFDIRTDCASKICVFEMSNRSDGKSEAELASEIVMLAAKCQEGHGQACICILPKNVDKFDVVAPPSAPEAVKKFIFGVMSFDHGALLSAHYSRNVERVFAKASPGVPESVAEWLEVDDFSTGARMYEHRTTKERRRTSPLVDSGIKASLVSVCEDSFLPRLKAMCDLTPKGIIVSQQSWRPDVDFMLLPPTFGLERLRVPVAVVSFEAGEELKATKASMPWIAMDVEAGGCGVFAWGTGTSGQLGLAGIENQDYLMRMQTSLIYDEQAFTSHPIYVANLHEHQVTSIACGTAHTIAGTCGGDIFTWGAAVALGTSAGKKKSDVPLYVEQLDGVGNTTRVFAGHHQSFAKVEISFASIS